MVSMVLKRGEARTLLDSAVVNVLPCIVSDNVLGLLRRTKVTTNQVHVF